MIRFFLAATFLLGSSQLACAQTSISPISSKNTSFSTELIDQFKDYCIENFLKEDAVKNLAKDRNAIALGDSDVKKLLHDDPGIGWKQTGIESNYTITLEHPPVQACAVRAPMKGRKFDLKILSDRIQEYVVANDYDETRIQPKTYFNPTNKTNNVAFISVISKKSNPRIPFENFFVIISVPQGELPESASINSSAEIRLVHQKVPPASTRT